MRKWRIEDSEELYNINGWGRNYFSINEKGHVVVTPRKNCASVDLKEVLDELQVRDICAPVLLRFPDILDNRIEKISTCFAEASRQYNYSASNFMIYPIKVNQMRQVVEEIVSYGKNSISASKQAQNPSSMLYWQQILPKTLSSSATATKTSRISSWLFSLRKWADAYIWSLKN